MRTYEATLRSLAPRVVGPMLDEATFIAFFGATLVLGPKFPTSSSDQLAVELSLRQAGKSRGCLLVRRPWIPGSV